MIKIQKFFYSCLIIILLLTNTSAVLAATKAPGQDCDLSVDTCSDPSFTCIPSNSDPTKGVCLSSTIKGGVECFPSNPNTHCEDGFSCQPSQSDPNRYICLKSSVNSVFGQINPPDAIKGFIGSDPTGEQGISKLLSNMVALFYTAAAVVLIFMLLWGAFDWITSGGEKEKLESARNKIINAIIGILLFAVAFAIIQVLGQFTGFKFFTGQ